MAGCSRNPAIPTLTLIFELFPYDKLTEAYLAPNGSLYIEFKPDSLFFEGGDQGSGGVHIV